MFLICKFILKLVCKCMHILFVKIILNLKKLGQSKIYKVISYKRSIEILESYFK